MLSVESSKLFQGMSTAELAGLKQATQELKFDAQQVIFQEGDRGDGIYIIKSGAVTISASVSSGQLRVLARLGPGDLFGEMAVLDNDPRSATADAQEPTVTYFIPRSEFVRMIERAPHLATSLVREVSRRLREFNHQYIHEVLESERLALVGRFASSIVHDLKDPLNVIGFSADVLVLPTAPPEIRLQCQVRVRKQIERISSMVNEVLEFARGTQAPVTLAREDYAGFIKMLMEEIQPEIEAKSVTLQLETAPPSVAVFLNRARLSRVFHNIVQNATDAMLFGGSITMRFKIDNNEVITELQDTGPGIAPQIAGRLFQAFASFGKSSGTGLGLSICKKIIEDHHGRIFARNAPEGGAVFSFALPIDPQ